MIEKEVVFTNFSSLKKTLLEFYNSLIDLYGDSILLDSIQIVNLNSKTYLRYYHE